MLINWFHLLNPLLLRGNVLEVALRGPMVDIDSSALETSIVSDQVVTFEIGEFLPSIQILSNVGVIYIHIHRRWIFNWNDSCSCHGNWDVILAFGTAISFERKLNGHFKCLWTVSIDLILNGRIQSPFISIQCFGC